MLISLILKTDKVSYPSYQELTLVATVYLNINVFLALISNICGKTLISKKLNLLSYD